MVDLDYKKLKSDERIAIWGGPSGSATGISNLGAPEADEINGVSSSMIQLSQSISWSDTEIPGVRSSEELNEPSLADPATYVEFGPTNYDGTLSFWEPRDNDDLGNHHAVVKQLTKTPRDILDLAVRIDGDKDALAPAAAGDYVSDSRQQILSETNPFDFSASVRRTVGLTGKGGFAHYTIVGDHSTPDFIAPTGGFVAGEKGRFRVEIEGRDYTNALEYTSGDPDKLSVFSGGFYEVAAGATGTVEITIYDRPARVTTVEEITIT